MIVDGTVTTVVLTKLTPLTEYMVNVFSVTGEETSAEPLKGTETTCKCCSCSAPSPPLLLSFLFVFLFVGFLTQPHPNYASQTLKSPPIKVSRFSQSNILIWMSNYVRRATVIDRKCIEMSFTKTLDRDG